MVEPGGQLGAYRLLHQIGSGGMGLVWLAERDDGEYRQRVAIKLLKRGMDSDEILARFRVERQILADLSHPNIARLLDGGITPDGLPYLVMEYVEGLPLDEYCRLRSPDLRARLSLFLGVCEAVHYAHQRLLIHRDIKPGNVLVTADGTPKLLDFGIVKLLDPAAVDRTQAMTGHAMLLLTPRYASPEQIRGEATATTTDVYALGCLLFELLTGRHPFHEALGDQPRLLREICLREPQRPSQCATVKAVAARQLAGDLDNIVLMALRKEPARRYGSVEQLRADVERHLRSEPVSARPSTLGYRTGRLLKRNPLAATGIAAAIVALVGGAAMSLWQAREANLQRQRAEQRLGDVRQLAHAMIFDVDAELEKGTTQARAVLVERALRYLDSLVKEQGLDALLKRDLAAAYEKIGDIEGNYTVINQLGRGSDAMAHYDVALKLRRELLAVDPGNEDYQQDLASSLQNLGDMRWSQGDAQAAHDSYSAAVKLLESLVGRAGAPLERQVNLARARNYLANVLYSQSRPSLLRFDDSMALHERSAAALRRLHQQHPAESSIRYWLESALFEMGNKRLATGRLDQAQPLLEEALALTRAWQAAEPDNTRALRAVALDLRKVAEVHVEAGRLSPAMQLMRESLQIRETLARQDPGNAGWQRDLAVALYTQAGWFDRLGQAADALAGYRRAAGIFRTLYERDRGNIVRRADRVETGTALAAALVRAGQLQEAQLLLEALGPELPPAAQLKAGAPLEEQAAFHAATRAELHAARRESAPAAAAAMDALRLQSSYSSADPLNVTSARDLARLQLRTAELLLSCRSGGDGSRCAALSMQPCELLRQSRATWERLESGAMLAHDYASHAARARELAARCPAT
jgi:tetratricopeptide (TPR) repeat protein